MQVTRLEIFGFKSFTERVVIPLEGGLTGIVGPNGCGKSNIVDALRWVLGETRASSLRGDTLEDVIFSGTETLRPLGLAEVSVTVRPRGSDFFSELAEQLRAYDALATLHEGEYADEGLAGAAQNFGLPEGGDVATNSDVEGEDRSGPPPLANGPKLTVLDGGVLDSGVSDESTTALESPSDETITDSPPSETHLETSSIAFLNRYAWLKGVTEVQITRRLYRSGESEFFINRVACRLRDIKELFRVLGLGARSHTIVAQGEVARLVTAKPEERRLVLEEAAGVAGLREKVAATRRRLEETSINVQRLSDVIQEVSRGVASLRRQATQARNRQAVKERILELERALFMDDFFCLEHRITRATALADRLSADDESCAAFVERLAAEDEQARSGLLEADVSSDCLRNRIDAVREELAQRMQARQQSSSKIAELQALLKGAEDELRVNRERDALLAQRHLEASSEVAQFEAAIEALNRELQLLEQSSDVGVQQASETLESRRAELRDHEGVTRELREGLSATQGALRELREQLVALSPITQLSQTYRGAELNALLNGLQPSDGASQGVAPTGALLIESLSVPRQLVKAVQAVLAERAAFLLVPDAHEVGALFNELTLSSQDHANQGPLPQERGAIGYGAQPSTGASGSRSGDQFRGLGAFSFGDEPLDVQERYGCRPLLAEITVAPHARRAARRCFSNVFFAPSLDTARQFFLSARDYRDDAGNVDPLYGQYVVVTLEGSLLVADGFYALNHEGGLVQLREKISELTAEVTRREGELTSRGKARELLNERIAAAQTQYQVAVEAREQRLSELRRLSNDRAALQGRCDAERRGLQQLETDQRAVQRALQELTERQKRLESEHEALLRAVESYEDSHEGALREELVKLQGEYQVVEEARRHQREVLSKVALELTQARTSLERVRTERSSSQLEVQRLALERQALVERFTNEFGTEVAEEAARSCQNAVSGTGDALALNESKRAELSDEAKRLRQRVVREGDVDPSSIQRYEEEAERLKQLEAQKSDLEMAAKTLESTISRLVSTSEQRFVATFQAVRNQFERIAPRLFGGGSGSIELSNPEKPLESGVDLYLKPPGKRPKSLELLSGGEKALCATALIVAMFLERPGPLCVLDEVDAPLDEANLGRFLALIKEMSAKTQFAMITHNKNSMTVADRLIGVTMAQPGSSQVIAVSLEEAYAQVA